MYPYNNYYFNKNFNIRSLSVIASTSQYLVYREPFRYVWIQKSHNSQNSGTGLWKGRNNPGLHISRTSTSENVSCSIRACEKDCTTSVGLSADIVWKGQLRIRFRSRQPAFIVLSCNLLLPLSWCVCGFVTVTAHAYILYFCPSRQMK